MTPLPHAAHVDLITARDAMQRAAEELGRVGDPDATGVRSAASYIANLLKPRSQGAKQ